MDDLRDRARGALVGVAVGDALGAAFEGWPRVGESDVRRVLEGDEPLRYTDDTAMTIVLAETLVADGAVDGARLAHAFAAAYAHEPWRGYGPGPPRIFALLDKGISWDEAARSLHAGEGSFGNGGAMRAAPVAIFAHDDLERTAALAREQASVTHAHPLGRDGAALQACAVAVVIRDGTAATPDGLLDAVRPVVETDGLAERLERIPPLLDGPDPQRLAATLGNGITAMEAVPAALAAFLAAPVGSFRGAIALAIRLGGDTDTIAAMTGALAGGAYGMQAIPAAWRGRVEGTAAIAELADALLEGRARDA